MNTYVTSSVIAMLLFGLGLTAVIMGNNNFKDNKSSATGSIMNHICWCIFFWNFGYAWMSLSFESDFAYIPRAIALLAITCYMTFILLYVMHVAEYPKHRLYLFLFIFLIASIIAWTQIIQKSAVQFIMTPWGYWYTSKLTWGRILQFASIAAATLQFYIILWYGRQHTQSKRQIATLKRFRLFGVILIVGYAVDTLIPTLFHVPAIPGSSICSFFSAMVLFQISRNNKIFGLTKRNASEYVFRDVKLPVIITDANNRIVLFNDATTNCLGCKHSDLLNIQLEDYITEHEEELYKIKTTGMICKLDTTVVNDQYGDLLYTIYFLQDITQERENYLIAQESQKMAEEANHAKSVFLENISHEIRIPINAILGTNGAIIRESNDEKIIEYATEIKRAGSTILGLLNDISDISQIENGQMEILPREYDVVNLIQEATQKTIQRTQEKSLDFQIQVDPSIPCRLIGDDNKIQQAIHHLLSNAVKFTQQGTVTLSISVTSQSATQIELLCSVKDTGIGMLPEEQQQLFLSFRQTNALGSHNNEGTGLGLIITNSILRLMNSRLLLRSTYKEGSEFSFYLTQKIANKQPIGENAISFIQI